MSFEDLQRQINELREYSPQRAHYDQLTQKVTMINEHTAAALESMNFCFYVCILTSVLFLFTVLVGVYVLRNFNYFKFMLRQNRFGRFTRPRSCYACYRPWRKLRVEPSGIKPSLSSPEAISARAPMPHREFSSFEEDSD